EHIYVPSHEVLVAKASSIPHPTLPQVDLAVSEVPDVLVPPSTSTDPTVLDDNILVDIEVLLKGNAVA
ncbi:unnamed protein product, partial [Ilex paraguariensis]